MTTLTEEQIARFCRAPIGTDDFGALSEGSATALCLAGIGVVAGPIRLQCGIPGPKGWGKAHIETAEGRLKQMERLGYPSCETFVEAIARNYQWIGEAGGIGKLAIVRRHLGYDLALIIRWNQTGFWSVTTGLPYRVMRAKKLLDVTQTGGSESPPKPTVAPRFETLSLPKSPGSRGS